MPSNRAIEAGRAVLTIVAVEEGVRGVLNEIERSLEVTATRVRNVGIAITASGIAGLGTLGLAIREASRAEEIGSKFAVVFGDATGEMRQFFRAMSDEVGRSEVDLQAFGAGFQDLLQPIGFDPSSAREFSGVLTQLAIDLGSFNDRADTAVVRDLQAALTGSSETVKRYGVVVNEAAVKQELLNQAIDPKSASEVDKVYARIAIILRQTAAAQGDAARTAGEVANQFKRLAGTVRDTAVAVGTALLPLLKPVLSVLNFVAEGVRDLAAAFPILTQVFAGASLLMVAFGAALTIVVTAVSSLLGPFTLFAIALHLLGISQTQALFAAGRLALSHITLAGTASAAAAAMRTLTFATRLFLATPIGVAIQVAVVALTLLVVGFGIAANSANAARLEMESFVQSATEIEKSQSAVDVLRALADAGKLTAEQLSSGEAALNDLGAKYGDLGIRIDGATGKIDTLEGAFAKLDERLKNDLIAGTTRELTDVTKKIGELQTELERLFKIEGITATYLDPIKNQLADARAEANKLRDELKGLRDPQGTGDLTDSQKKEQGTLNDRNAQRLRDEEIANIENTRERRLTTAREIAEREIKEAERVAGDKTIIERRLALELARINREADSRLDKDRQRESERVLREQENLQREGQGFAADRRDAELRVALEGRELELALLREQEKEKIKLARERGIATLDIEREFAARRAQVNNNFEKQEEARKEKDGNQRLQKTLQLARSQEILGTLATRAAGQQFSRGGDRVAGDSLNELKGINRRLGRIERKPGGIRVN